MTKTRIGLIGLLSTSVVAILAIATGTFAWFAEHTLNDPVDVNINGSASPYHYASGTGTSGDPYIIRDPIHLYNLAWLQYLGTYNKDENEDGAIDQQWYFKLSDEISASGLDMSGYTLPPIGTEDYPFIGNFNGNNKKIVNLTTSNNETDFGDRIPHNLVYTAPEIVGFFGVVGAIEGDSTPTYDSSINTFINTSLDNFTVKSNTEQTLIGLAAGYVNGTMSGIKLGGTTKIDVNSRVCTAIGGNFTKLSNYGIVGYTTKRAGTGDYSQTITEYYNEGDADGTGDEWGGSIDFKAFNKRMHYYLNNKELTKPDINWNDDTHYANRFRYFSEDDIRLTTYRSNDNKASSARNTTLDTYYANDPETNEVYYALTGEMINETWYSQKNTGTTPYSTSLSVAGTVQPLIIDDNYETNSRNTGYLVSGHTITTTKSGRNLQSQVNPSFNSASKPIRFVSNSLGDTYFNNESSSYNIYRGNNGPYPNFNENKFEVLTNSSASYSASNYVLIKDSYNSSHTPAITGYTKSNSTTPEALGLKKYGDSRDTLNSVLTSASFIHGIHFRGETTKDASAFINTTDNVTISNATINGSSYATYTLPTSCIDFSLKEEGYINFFAGSYFNKNTNTPADTDSFFSLWKITRNESTQAITSVQQIRRIFKSNDPGASEKYIYDFTGSTTPSNSTLAFDLGFLSNNPPVQNAVYYFELPVNAGEYAMGVCDRKAGGAYLMYLDIGTAGELSDQIDTYSVRTESNVSEHPVGVDFAVTGYDSNGGTSFGIEIDSGNQGTIQFVVSSTGTNVTITSSDDFAAYSYKKTAPPYTISGDTNIGELGDPPGGGTIVHHIRVKTVAQNVYNVMIYDEIDEYDNVTSIYELNNSIVSLSTLQSRVALLTNDMLALIRGRNEVIVLTRSDGSNTFNVELPELPWTNKTLYDITLDATGITIDVSVAEGINATINGDSVSDGDTYPSS